jgi:hypothetical protein
MDGFNIIQNFFTRMRCNFCEENLEPEGVQLIRHDKGVYIVNVHCTHCTRQMGTAMVGIEGAELTQSGREYVDPELTESELERLADYKPIGYDDVLEAHQFFTNLDSDWRKYLPKETLEWDITSELESEAS